MAGCPRVATIKNLPEHVQEAKATKPDLLDGAHDRAEDVADRRTKQGENYDHDNGDQHKNQRVLHKSLSFFLRCE